MSIFATDPQKLTDVISLARQVLGQASWDIDVRYLMANQILAAKTQWEYDAIREDVITYTVAKSTVIGVELKLHTKNSTA